MRLHLNRARWRSGSSRKGTITFYALLGLVLLLVALGVAVDVPSLWGTQTELHAGTDAAALAAAHCLASDELLRLQVEDPLAWLAASRRQAIAFARANQAGGQAIELLDNPENRADGDVVFGYYEPVERRFHAAPQADLEDPRHAVLIHAVRVTAHRTRERGNAAGLFLGPWLGLRAADVVASSTAIVDWEVVGFRPLHGATVPLVPIALLSDPTAAERDCWEAQTQPNVDARGNVWGRDNYLFDSVKKRLVAVGQGVSRGDGILEVKATLVLDGQESRAKSSACLLRIGGQGEWGVLCRQVQAGVSAQDLEGPEFGGQLSLGMDNELRLPGWYVAPRADRPELGQLLNSLMSLQTSAEPRIWPLFVRPAFASPQGESFALVRGFVAARVARVELESFDDGGVTRQRVCVILQPCVLSTSTAMTDARQRQGRPETWGRYVCKVRLAE